MGKGKPKASKHLHRARIPHPQPPPPEEIRFSFKHIDLHTNAKFGVSDCGGGYLVKLLERLRAIEGMALLEFRTSGSSALRCHPIDWSGTSEPAGFTSLNQQLRDLTPYQFSVSGNAHGRVHGFFLGAVFYIVWLDPNHRLYPGNH